MPKVTLLKIILFFLTVVISSTNSTFAQQTRKLNLDSLLVGKWVKKIDKTKDGKEYFGLKCKDTIEYLQTGNFIWNQCGINETGKWKISKDKKKIIHYQCKSKYWEDYLHTKDIGQMDIPIVSLTQQQLVTIISDEEKGAINQYYSKTK
jgi:hypothetical protein